jgi:hypothetical protein
VAKAQTLSSSTVSSIKSILRRSITRAQARDRVKPNVVLLCGTPTGQPGRPSKSLTLDQAHALVEHATGSTIGAYVLLALLIGARTEELRALTWSHVDLNGRPDPDPAVLPTSGSGVRSAPAATPRPAPRGAPSPSPAAASTPCASTATAKTPAGPRQARTGPTTTSSSPPAPVVRWTRPTSDATSGASPPPRALTPPPGHHGSCGTVSCHCCPTKACQSSRLPDSSATRADRPSPKPSTASSCGPSSMTARSSWIASSTRAESVTQVVTQTGLRKPNGPVQNFARSP